MICPRCTGTLVYDYDGPALRCVACSHRIHKPFVPHEVKRSGRQSERYCACGAERLSGRTVCRRCYGLIQAQYRARKAAQS